MARLRSAFPDIADMTVIDLGGRRSTWSTGALRPRSVLCVNLEHQDGADDTVRCVTGDACDDAFVRSLGTFDLAYSNSTIEHVGGHVRRAQFAANVRAVASHYWIQTPDRYTPVEPHAVLPGFQFLPVWLRWSLARRWPLSPLGTGGDLLEEILSIDLLSATELRFYFPDAQIWKERVAGLPKSLVAYR